MPYADVAQLVEHNLAKVGVAGSNPVVRSKELPEPGNLPAPGTAPHEHVAWGSGALLIR